MDRKIAPVWTYLCLREEGLEFPVVYEGGEKVEIIHKTDG
jgi:hypothetical protein